MREGFLSESGVLMGWGAQFEGSCRQFRGKPCEGSPETGAVYQRRLYALLEVETNMEEGPECT